jgi:hypothetical protein
MSICQVIEGAGVLVLAAGSHAGWLSEKSILLIMFLLGVVRAFEGPTLQALMPNLVAGDLFPRAAAWVASVTQSAVMIGPALGGFLYVYGPTTVYSIIGLPFLSASLLISLLHYEPNAGAFAPGAGCLDELLCPYIQNLGVGGEYIAPLGERTQDNGLDAVHPAELESEVAVDDLDVFAVRPFEKVIIRTPKYIPPVTHPWKRRRVVPGASRKQDIITLLRIGHIHVALTDPFMRLTSFRDREYKKTKWSIFGSQPTSRGIRPSK